MSAPTRQGESLIQSDLITLGLRAFFMIDLPAVVRYTTRTLFLPSTLALMA